jgi:hypothetical protein
MKKNAVFMRGAIVSTLFAVTIIQPVALGRGYAKSVAAVENNSVRAIDDPEAVYQGARIVHNVTVKGQKGMRVHAKFTVKHGYDVACKMIAYFYYENRECLGPNQLYAGVRPRGLQRSADFHPL